MPTFSEPDLVIPALEIIAAHPDGIGTSELLSLLRRQLQPAGEDLEILAGRCAGDNLPRVSPRSRGKPGRRHAPLAAARPTIRSLRLQCKADVSAVAVVVRMAAIPNTVQ
jgi:hypothetical protein